MGFLAKLFGKSQDLLPLPSGSFTVDSEGRVLASTLPHNYPTAFAKDIASEVLGAFRAARDARIPLAEMMIRYSSLKLTARELRGGAIIFLTPQTLSSQSKLSQSKQ